jgi:hypothetical protein
MQPDPLLILRYRAASFAAALVTLFIGATALIGWLRAVPRPRAAGRRGSLDGARELAGLIEVAFVDAAADLQAELGQVADR